MDMYRLHRRVGGGNTDDIQSGLDEETAPSLLCNSEETIDLQLEVVLRSFLEFF